MKSRGFNYSLVIGFAGMFILATSTLLSAGRAGIPDGMIKGAYRQMLSGADTNRDGKLSKAECMATMGDRKQAVKDCNYWDANGDGIITESEYVAQVKRLGD